MKDQHGKLIEIGNTLQIDYENHGHTNGTVKHTDCVIVTHNGETLTVAPGNIITEGVPKINDEIKFKKDEDDNEYIGTVDDTDCLLIEVEGYDTLVTMNRESSLIVRDGDNVVSKRMSVVTVIQLQLYEPLKF